MEVRPGEGEGRRKGKSVKLAVKSPEEGGKRRRTATRGRQTAVVRAEMARMMKDEAIADGPAAQTRVAIVRV